MGHGTVQPSATPFPQKADDIVKQLAQPVAIHDDKLVKEYQALVGSFLCLQVHTFPEISWAVSVLSKYMIRPGPTHLVIAKKLLRYLKGRKNILYDGTLKTALALTSQAQFMVMPTHPLPIQYLIDTHQSDTSSCSTELLFLGAPVELP